MADAQPDVTAVVTDRSWWNGGRPGLLNRRQRLNANLARSVLTRVDGADWLFHLDADEIAQIDRAELATVPASAPAVNLRPLEVVSPLHPEGEPRLFKRLLEEPDLLLLRPWACWTSRTTTATSAATSPARSASGHG